jgi:hypothetical protein
MARLVVIDPNVGTSIYLKDLEYKQRQTIFPPGQDRYVAPIDLVALQAALTDNASVVTPAAFIVATVDANDISLANIVTESGVVLPPDQAQLIQDILSYRIVETGYFMLSFDRGQISKLVSEGTVKVFTEDGTAIYAL